MPWTDPHPAAWATGERLKASDLSSYLQSLLRDQAPRLIDGSTHTPAGIVRVLGSVGMLIETLRGRTTMTYDGTNEPRLTVINNAGTKSVQIDAATGKVTVTDGFEFASRVSFDHYVPLVNPFNFIGGGTPPVPSKWSLGFISGTPYGRMWTQTDVSGTHLDQSIHFDIPKLPNGSRIESIRMYIDGNGGGSSHGALPTNRPLIGLGSLSPNNTLTYFGEQADISASVAAYETAGWLVYTPSSPVDVVDGYSYFAHVRGENGTNAVPSALRLYAISVSYSSVALGR